MRSGAVAFRAYLAPMGSSRSTRIGFFLGLAALAVIAAGAILERALPSVFSHLLSSLRKGIIVPGVPLAAVLAGEMPIRDGLRRRTLLYPILGPASRSTLAVVRTAMTATVLALLATGFLVLLQVLGGGGWASLPRDVLAIVFGSAAYTGLFGLVHLVSRRGLIGSLVFYLLLDQPIAQIPFSLRVISPSYHLSVLAGRVTQFALPVPVTPAEVSPMVSGAVLALVAIGSVIATAYLFSRKNLGELC